MDDSYGTQDGRYFVRKMSRKNVLIIAWFCLPRPSVASRRLGGLAKYLKDYNWIPIILTAELPHGPRINCRTVETPYHDVIGSWKRKVGFDPRTIKTQTKITSNLLQFALTRLGEIIAYPDSEKGWFAYAIQYARKILESEDIDAIISISSPVTCHLIAKELKEEYKIPWIADLRDLWTQNHYYPYSIIRKMIERRLEKKTLCQADALVAVSQPSAEKLKELHKDPLVYVVTNGFDPEEVNILPKNLTPKFTITWTGTIYYGKQDPLKILEATRSLISDGALDPKDIEIRFYGTVTKLRDWWLEEQIKRLGLENVAKFYGDIPREEALEKQRESQILLFLDWDDPREKGAYSAKIFEYLAAQRPIVATGGPQEIVSELLEETRAGTHAPNIEDVKSALKKFYYEYKSDGQVKYKGKKSKINKYSHKEMARKFSEILDTLTRNQH